jgi:hypothetical protein
MECDCSAVCSAVGEPVISIIVLDPQDVFVVGNVGVVFPVFVGIDPFS